MSNFSGPPFIFLHHICDWAVKCDHLGMMGILGFFRGQSREVAQIRSLDSFVLWLIKWLINPKTCQLEATSIFRCNWVFENICPTLQWRSRMSAGPQAPREVMGSEVREEESPFILCRGECSLNSNILSSPNYDIHLYKIL